MLCYQQPANVGGAGVIGVRQLDIDKSRLHAFQLQYWIQA